MSKKIFTPINQVRFTNVAIVRLKKGGLRFEIACYKNKVVEWRKQVETSLDEVLQTPTIFTNTSKGVAAKRKDLQKCFGTTDETKIAEIILEKGEVQVAGEERKVENDTIFNEIASIVSEKCVHPDTQRQIPVKNIEKAMRDIHYSIVPGQNAKKQALDVIKKIQKELPEFPMERAHMRLRIVIEGKEVEGLKEKLNNQVVKWQEAKKKKGGEEEEGEEEEEEEEEEKGDRVGIEVEIKPENYRAVNDVVQKTFPNATVEVAAQYVHVEGDAQVED